MKKRTYLVIAPKTSVFGRYPASEVFYTSYTRSVIVTDSPPPEEWVADSLPGECAEKYQWWVNRTILDELHSEYLRDGRIRRTRTALKRLGAAFERRRAAEKALAAAIRLERAASREAVIACGRVCVVIAGEMYDPSYTDREEVYYVKRKVLKKPVE